MSFSMARGQENKLSFLNVKIICEQGKFTNIQSTENLLIVAYTVSSKDFYFLIINLVWYII